MKRKNRYIVHAKISESKTRLIVRLFALDLTASQIAELSRLNRNTVNRLVFGFRKLMAARCEAGTAGAAPDEEAAELAGMCAHQSNGDTGSLAGITIHRGVVFTEMVPLALQDTAYCLLRNRGCFSALGCVGPWPGYDSLVDLNRQKYIRVNYGGEGSARYRTCIAMAESFWAFTKTRLTRFRGVHRHTLYYHLKECEFRFNFREEDMYHLLLALIRKHPLSSS